MKAELRPPLPAQLAIAASAPAIGLTNKVPSAVTSGFPLDVGLQQGMQSVARAIVDLCAVTDRLRNRLVGIMNGRKPNAASEAGSTKTSTSESALASSRACEPNR